MDKLHPIALLVGSNVFMTYAWTTCGRDYA